MKLKKNILIMLLGILIPFMSIYTSSAQAEDEFGPGDYTYEEGLYLTPLCSLSLHHIKDGEMINPYGKSKVGKISEAEKNILLNNTTISSLMKAYNRLYRLTIKYYKYGENNIDKWKKVKNMNDPVFGNVNKKDWIDIYTGLSNTLADVKYYFYSKGLDDEDFTEAETSIELVKDSRFVIDFAPKYKK